MKDYLMTERPQLSWVEVPTADGGSRLEMRWDTAHAPVSPAIHAA